METLQDLTLEGEYYRKPVRKHVFQFSLLCAAILIFLAVRSIIYYGGLVDAVAYGVTALVLVTIGKRYPRFLFYPWRSWMSLASLLSVVVTPVIMAILWVGIVIPTALILRLTNIRRIDKQFRNPKVESYWVPRLKEKDDPKLFARQY